MVHGVVFEAEVRSRQDGLFDVFLFFFCFFSILLSILLYLFRRYPTLVPTPAEPQKEVGILFSLHLLLFGPGLANL